MFVLLIQFLWKWIDELVGKGIDWVVIAKLMFYVSATLVPLAMPLAVLLSSLMTFGNLGENYELIALKASGVSLQKTMRPLVVLMVFLSVGAFYFSNNVMPAANLEFRTLLRDIRIQKPSVSIKEGAFYTNITDMVIRIGSKDDDGVGIRNIIIYDHSQKNGNTNVTVAKNGRMEMTADKKNLVFTLFDGHNYNENVNNQRTSNAKNRPMQKTSFGKEIRRIDLTEFSFSETEGSVYKNNYKMLNIHQLKFYIDSLLIDQDSTFADFLSYTVEDFGFMSLYKDIQKEESATEIQNQSEMELQDTVVNPIDSKQEHAAIMRTEESKEAVHDGSRELPTNKEPDDYYDARDSFYSFPLDTSLALQSDYLLNFSSNDQERIIESALSNARNSSFHTDIVTNNMESKARLIRKHEIEFYRKYTLSFACIILFFIGAPLGAIIRKGGLGMPVIISVLLFVVYHVLTMIGEKSTKELAMDPILGMWLANLIFLPVGIFLMYKAASDSPLLDAESWRKSIGKIFSIFKK